MTRAVCGKQTSTGDPCQRSAGCTILHRGPKQPSTNPKADKQKVTGSYNTDPSAQQPEDRPYKNLSDEKLSEKLGELHLAAYQLRRERRQMKVAAMDGRKEWKDGSDALMMGNVFVSGFGAFAGAFIGRLRQRLVGSLVSECWVGSWLSPRIG